MAFAAVLTALGYYIILRRFCQGLLKIFLQGAATGGKFSLFAACHPRLWLTSLPPVRYLFDLPRGRGSSQTPPSRATDSSISPGPPSPWLPALPIEWLFYRFCGELAIPKAHPRRVRGSPPAPVPPGFNPGGAGGSAPGEINFESPPSPLGKGVGGIGGRKISQRRGRQAAKKASHRGTCSICPGGEDHLKRRRRVRRIVPSPPVPPLLGCRHCQ